MSVQASHHPLQRPFRPIFSWKQTTPAKPYQNNDSRSEALFLKKKKEKKSDPKITEVTNLKYRVFFPKKMGIPCKFWLPFFFGVAVVGRQKGWVSQPSASTVASCPNKICFFSREKNLMGAYKVHYSMKSI